MSIKDEGQKVIDAVRNADAQADSLLDKVKNSNWTAAILCVAGAAVIVMMMFAWLVG
jgi:hypothetical protein